MSSIYSPRLGRTVYSEEGWDYLDACQEDRERKECVRMLEKKLPSLTGNERKLVQKCLNSIRAHI